MSIFMCFARSHPDKTSDPNAETKFIEIKRAYELLVDPERRKAYDLRGVTSEDAFMLRGNADYSQYGRFATDPFEEFFGYARPIHEFTTAPIKLALILQPSLQL